MWKAFWVFCAIYPAIYFWLTPFNWISFFICWAIIFAWDYVNYLEYQNENY